MSEPVLEFLVHSTTTLVITIVTGSLVACGLLFEIVWHVHQRTSKGPIAKHTVDDTVRKEEDAATTMIHPIWVSMPISEIKNEMRCFHERMNKQEKDINTVKEAVIKLVENLHLKK